MAHDVREVDTITIGVLQVESLPFSEQVLRNSDGILSQFSHASSRTDLTLLKNTDQITGKCSNPFAVGAVDNIAGFVVPVPVLQGKEQDGQYSYKLSLRCVLTTIVEVEKP